MRLTFKGSKMARKDRTGKRKSRNQRVATRVPDMGYYLIVTDTEATERCFFTGLQESLPDEIKGRLVIKVIETKTQNLIQKCTELMTYDPQYRIPWIVFDRDQVVDFDKIIKDARNKSINVGWSNPCFEIWMFSYFGRMPAIYESWTCCDKFGDLYKAKTGRDYSKANEDMYKTLCDYGNEEIALQISRQKYEQHRREGKMLPSQMCPATTVHELVGEIKRKTSISSNSNLE